MTRKDKRQVISQIFKFETISSYIFAATLVSCHLELTRVKQSFFDRQRGNVRAYANRLSIFTQSMALIWIFGLAIFYLSLALVYGRFTWYFCWPSLILGAMSGIYLTQTVMVQFKAQKYSRNEDEQNQKLAKLQLILTVCSVLVIFGFNRIILNNTLTTILSGCIWFP